MKRSVAFAIAFCLFAVGCGGDDPAATTDDALQTCLADDPNCGLDTDLGAESPDVVTLMDPDDPGSQMVVDFRGFFFSDGTSSKLCSALAESLPPQCAEVVVDIAAPLDVVLEHVAESFGNPEDAKINIEQGVYWTDDWVNLSGTMQSNFLVLE